MEHMQCFLKEEDGIETVEVVLIMVILVALVLAFKGKITEVVNNTLTNVTKNSKSIIG